MLHQVKFIQHKDFGKKKWKKYATMMSNDKGNGFMAVYKEKITKNFFEKKAWEQGHYTCGLDEVGRGCLAGPLVVGAVVIPPYTNYRLLKDSKVLTAEERLKAFAWIDKHCSWSIAFANHKVIDSINIYQATLYAMRRAYLQLLEKLPFPVEKLKYVLIDAMPLSLDASFTHSALEYYHFPHGERLSASIAAASIVAKVMRDQLMEVMAQYFPVFGFEQHKGYATQQHISALLSQGPTIIHRHSFIQNIKSEADIQEALQQSLF